MMKAVALDDERPALDVIETFCDQLDSVELVRTFTRTGEAHLYLETNLVDLIFLDINMPKESGLAFCRSLSAQTLVIFTTAYSEFALESYDVEAVDYILKPYSFERFQKAVQRAQTRRQMLKPASNPTPIIPEPIQLFVRVDHSLVKITVADILFIEGMDNYLKVYLRDGSPLVLRLTLKALLDKLPTANFIRIHRSYIVAVDKIQGVRGRMILIGKAEIPIGNRYEKEFFNLFM